MYVSGAQQRPQFESTEWLTFVALALKGDVPQLQQKVLKQEGDFKAVPQIGEGQLGCLSRQMWHS